MTSWNNPYDFGISDKASLEEYLEWRVEILIKQFKITLTEEEYDRLRRLDSKHDIDRAIRKIMKNRWHVD